MAIVGDARITVSAAAFRPEDVGRVVVDRRGTYRIGRFVDSHTVVLAPLPPWARLWLRVLTWGDGGDATTWMRES